MSNDKWHQDQGEYFGYPQCCITWFIEERANVELHKRRPLTEKQESVHNFRGFIPCPVCAEKVTSQTVDTLIQNRKCPSPYPKDI